MTRWLHVVLAILSLLVMARPDAVAGPPYISDDPAPTDEDHFEIYAFTEGEHEESATEGSLGIDFNYGAGPNLQLSVTVPMGFAFPGRQFALGSVEVAAKYRFQRNAPSGGWDAAFFPELSFPSGSSKVGDSYPSLFLPLWFEHDWESWSTFGGGGCTISQGGDSQNFCQASWALTNQISRRIQIGGEIAIASADTRDGVTEKRVGLGVRYDADDTYHFLAYTGTALGGSRPEWNYSWYLALLSTF
jgi:hypothetical protein